MKLTFPPAEAQWASLFFLPWSFKTQKQRMRTEQDFQRWQRLGEPEAMDVGEGGAEAEVGKRGE